MVVVLHDIAPNAPSVEQTATPCRFLAMNNDSLRVRALSYATHGSREHAHSYSIYDVDLGLCLQFACLCMHPTHKHPLTPHHEANATALRSPNAFSMANLQV
jgi:hypothetical protein